MRGNVYMNLDNLVDSKTRSLRDRLENFGIRVAKSIGAKIRNRYGYTVEVMESYSIRRINDWLSTVDPNYNSRSISDNKLLSDTSFVLSIDVNTFIYVVAGNPLANEAAKMMMDMYRSRDSDEAKQNNYIKLFIYGKHAKKYLTKLKEEIISNKRLSDELVIYNVSANKTEKDQDSFQSIITSLNPRKLDTLFYDNNIKEEIVEHIDAFFRNKSVYESRNINFKTSILLYGEPGTGKSSLANALCDKYDLNMVLVDMNSFDKLDLNILNSCINGDDKTYIVVLEDIDTVFALNRDEEGEGIADKDDKKVINKLLQFMDSNNSPSNVIFIATTNHVDRLDKAITRRGRIDKQVYVGPIGKHIARQMCKSFGLTDDHIQHILDNHKDDETINQSTLQGEILDELKLTLSENEDKYNGMEE